MKDFINYVNVSTKKEDVLAVIDKVLNDGKLSVLDKAILHNYFRGEDITKNPMFDLIKRKNNEMNYFIVYDGIMYATDESILFYMGTTLPDGYYDESFDVVLNPFRTISKAALENVTKLPKDYDVYRYKETIIDVHKGSSSERIATFESIYDGHDKWKNERPIKKLRHGSIMNVGIREDYWILAGKPKEIKYGDVMFHGGNESLKYCIAGFLYGE
jgi:hypothetical protein